MQTYPWFDVVPSHLKTRRQLKELGLRPGGPIVAQVVWKRGERFANLYDVNTAKPKRAATPAQLAALENAQLKRRLCPRCGKDTGSVVWRRFRPGRDCPHCVEKRELAEATRRHQDAVQAAATARVWLRSPRTVIIDTETTSLDGYLIELAIIDMTGTVLFNGRINPEAPISDGAREVHHITDEQLVLAPTFAEVWPQVWPLLRGRRIVTYNSDFDASIFVNEAERRIRAATSGSLHRGQSRQAAREIVRIRRGGPWRCAMQLYAVWVGDWSRYHGDYRWQPLPGGDHSALGDALATLRLLQRMAGDDQTTAPELEEDGGATTDL